MASIHDEENIIQEETGRRTRSGRKVVTPSTPTRNTRRSRKQTQEQVTEETEVVCEDKQIIEDDVTYAQSDIIKEMLAEAAQGVLVAHNREEEEDENIQYTEIPDASEIHDVIETVEIEGVEVPDTIDTSVNEVDMMIQYSDEQIIQADDEKSSSFPFGSVQQSENSDGKTDENVTNISECVDSSLLASLVGDNANSLPSAGEESQSKDNFEVVTNDSELGRNVEIPLEISIESKDDSKSYPAIVENLPNGETMSDKTIPDVYAEIISEDELTTSNKPKVFDADVISEDELPIATEPSKVVDATENVSEDELLASNKESVDAEIVSEDELPSSNKEPVTDAEIVSEDELPTSNKEPVADAEVVSEDELPASNNEPVADAEVVSEDELPAPIKVEIKDAEEVSDDELPGPQRAELPADTEVVSDDELPTSAKKTSAKRKASEEYNPSSPTSEDADVPEKKVKLDIEAEEKEKEKLPELEKFWKAVQDDPADFTGWTYLLQYVDQENDVEAAREAYDAFLAHYPYCYGYWRKYADYEKRKGNKRRCEEVFERGLKAIPLSVDLWIHYLTHVKANFADNDEYIRSQFERALNACGLEFRSDKLWEAYIKWELEGKRYSEVANIYDRLLATPTQGYNAHFDSYQDLVNNQSPTIIVSIEEFKKIRSEVREVYKQNLDNKHEINDNEMTKEKNEKIGQEEEDLDMEKVTDKDLEKEKEADDHIQNEDELAAIRDKIISSRRRIHKATITAVTARWVFEEGIKRPYFHVKPLEKCQLKNWRDYLDFEIEKDDRKRVLILFERCLIACALYDEFWLKLIRYLESQNDSELVPITRDVFERACSIHHPDKPSLHLMWSAFEECQNNFDKAAEILRNLEKLCPNLLQIAYRRINLERRRGDYDKCKELYEHYVSTAKNKNISGSLAIKYARFLHKICGNLEDGYNILKQTLEKDPSNTRVALQMIDLALQRDKVDENEIVQIMDKFMSRDNIDPEQKVLFAQRKVEFLEDFGSTAKGLQDAQRALQIALNKMNEVKKKSESSPNKKPPAPAVSSLPSTIKDTTNTVQIAGTTQTSSSSYNNSYSGYGSGSTNPQYYGNSQSYQSYDSYGYNHWQQSGYGYSGYGQWSGYGNYY